MTPDANIPDEDEGEEFCEGDTPLDDINWSKVTNLQARQEEALALPEGEERSMAMLGLLQEMHGDELEVL